MSQSWGFYSGNAGSPKTEGVAEGRGSMTAAFRPAYGISTVTLKNLNPALFCSVTSGQFAASSAAAPLMTALAPCTFHCACGGSKARFVQVRRAIRLHRGGYSPPPALLRFTLYIRRGLPAYDWKYARYAR